MSKCLLLFVAVVAWAMAAVWADEMPFFKDNDDSVTNRIDNYIPASAPCETVFSNQARVKTVSLTGLNLRIGKAPIVIILR